jgi:hypothetical protein
MRGRPNKAASLYLSGRYLKLRVGKVRFNFTVKKAVKYHKHLTLSRKKSYIAPAYQKQKTKNCP